MSEKIEKSEKRGLDQVDPLCRSYLMEHGVNAVLLCPNCDHELLVGVSVMPWRKEDGNNSKAEDESSPTSSKKQKTEDHGKNGTARVSFDGVGINTAKTEESSGSNLDDDDTVDDGSVSLLI
jgi:hypothetical protein